MLFTIYSKELTNRLGTEVGLIVVPGKSFGKEGYYFRLSMICTRGQTGLKSDSMRK